MIGVVVVVVDPVAEVLPLTPPLAVFLMDVLLLIVWFVVFVSLRSRQRLCYLKYPHLKILESVK